MHSESAHAKAAPAEDVFSRIFGFIGCFPAADLDQAWKEWVRFVALSAPLHLILAKVGTSALTVPSVALIVASVLGALLAFVGGSQRLAIGLIAATLGLKSVLLFPETPNHLYLHALIAMFTWCGFAQKGTEAGNALTALRWIAVIVLLWAGIQKLVYGVYFRGEYLAYVVSTKPFVRSMLAFSIPQAELQQLVSFGQPSLGDGPYRVSSPVLWAAGNATWLGEIGVALGLLFARTRKAAAIATFGLLAAIEIVMREFVFGALMLALTGLHLSTRGMQRSTRCALGVLVLLIFVRVFATQRQWWFN